VRTEFADWLLQNRRFNEAISELIPLSEGVDTSDGHAKLGDMFLRAGDPSRALTAYQAALRSGSSSELLFGAGTAAYQLSRYRLALRYLSAAARDRKNEEAQRLAAEVSSILELDPYVPGISDANRARRIRAAFAVAQQTVDSCPTPALAAQIPVLSGYQKEVAARKFARDPELQERVLDSVYLTVQLAAESCGNTTPQQAAVLRLARERAAAGATR
jgi:tetratricopeptide (TPR) repeat protein